MDDITPVLEELKRYLARRRRSGLDVVHRLDGTPGRVRCAGERRERRGGERESRSGGVREAVGSRPEARSESARERKGARVSGRSDAGAGGGRTIQAGEHSIRYRHESRSPAQESLFSDNRREEGPDVSGLDLGALGETVSTCMRCPLGRTRTKAVFGSGSPDARIVFIGEAPGREEDLQGLPFVGRAGQLLTKILASVGMSREEVYITNILKCRPPENRDPQEEEVKACSVYLHRQIELIDPALVCALGRIAGQHLLQSTASLSALRQSIHFYNDIPVVVMYHPAALLRNPNLKRAAWEDIKMVRRMYDEALGSG